MVVHVHATGHLSHLNGHFRPALDVLSTSPLRLRTKRTMPVNHCAIHIRHLSPLGDHFMRLALDLLRGLKDEPQLKPSYAHSKNIC